MKQTKKCTKCCEVKDFSEYYKNTQCKNGLHPTCKDCHKEYYKNNKEQTKKIQKQYRKNNKEYIKEKNKSNKENNKEYYKEYNKEYKKNNKEYIKEYNKEYHKQNKEKIKEYRKQNKENRRKSQNKWVKNRTKTDSLFKLSQSLRNRTNQAFKRTRWHKLGGTEQVLGCSFEVAHTHLEKQFTEGMTWANHGEWHIDHIIPLASANTKEELKKLCHYTNLQPLWALDNLIKSDKLPHEIHTF